MIYRHSDLLGSKLAIILQEPLRSTVPFIPPCVTWEKYFTARCAKPLQAIAAHLTAVYHSCTGYSIVKILCPSTYRELGETFCSPVFQKLCEYAQAEAYGSCLFCPLLIKNWDSLFGNLFRIILLKCINVCSSKFSFLSPPYIREWEKVFLKFD